MYFVVLFVSLKNCLEEVDEIDFNHTLKDLETRSPRQSERSSSVFQELSQLKEFGEEVPKLGVTLTDQQVTLLFLVDVVNKCCSNLRPPMNVKLFCIH